MLVGGDSCSNVLQQCATYQLISLKSITIQLVICKSDFVSRWILFAAALLLPLLVPVTQLVEGYLFVC